MNQNKGRPPLPVDRGWAWFVMLGAFLNTFFHFIFLRSLSIFFIEFLDKFQQSATVTTLAFGLNTAAFILGALLLPSVFLSRFTVRFVTILGSCITGAAIIGVAFSPNMICLIAMFVFIGFAHPLIFVSQVTLLGEYFKKRLSFAVAFANLGLSGALMIGPYLTRILLDSYGLTGSLLIHAGINLNLIAFCMLFRPVSFYAERFDVCYDLDINNPPGSPILEIGRGTEYLETEQHDEKVPETKSLIIEKDRGFRSTEKEVDYDYGDNERNNLLIEESSSNPNQHDTIILCHPRITQLQRNGSEDIDISVSGSQQSLESHNTIKSFQNSQSSLNFSNGKTQHWTSSEMNINFNKGKNQNKFNEMCTESTFHSKSSLAAKRSLTHSISQSSKSILDFVSSSRSIHYLSSSTIYLDRMISSLSHTPDGSMDGVLGNISNPHSRNSKIMSVEICDNNILTQTGCNAFRNQKCDRLTSRCSQCEPAASSSSITNNSESPKSCTTNDNNSKCALLNPLVVMLWLLAGFGVNTQCGAAYMPSLGKEQGVSTDKLPILMTVIGAADLCKLAIGYIADKGFIRRIYIVLACQLIIGISFQFSSYFQGFAGLVILCIIFGLNTGVLHILLPGITVDLLGPEYIGQVMSGYFLINGAQMTLCHILIGSLKDLTGSFVMGYNLLGGFLLFGALIIFMEPLFVRLSSKQRVIN